MIIVNKLWWSQVKAALFRQAVYYQTLLNHDTFFLIKITLQEKLQPNEAQFFSFVHLIKMDIGNHYFHTQITGHSSDQCKIWCLYIFCGLMSVQHLLKWPKCGSARGIEGSGEKQNHLTLKEWSENDDTSLTSRSFSWLGAMKGG